MPMKRLVCEVQNYAWGKMGLASKVAQMKQIDGETIDSAKPYAEYWLGTHPKAPSRVEKMDGSLRLLKDWLRSRPKLLGSLRTDGSLPFLFKVLSVNQALSIQAHPNKDLAKVLHARDKEHYRDDNHKPEMAIALTDFEAMCGFRPIKEIETFVRTVPEFGSILDAASKRRLFERPQNGDGDGEALRAIFASWMAVNKETVAVAVRKMVQRLKEHVTLSDSPLRPAEDLALRLAGKYDGDVGVFAPFVLNYVKMRPGDGIFLRANMPHSYLKGDIVECMACSDNVVRAGLTPKFRDVETLVKMLDYTSVTVEDLKMRPQNVDSLATLYAPEDISVNEFEVISIDVPSGKEYTLAPYTSPSIVLVHDGYGHVVTEDGDDEDEDILMPGSVYLLPAGQSVTVQSSPKGSLRIFSARCREGFYAEHNDDGSSSSSKQVDDAESATKVEAKIMPRRQATTLSKIPEKLLSKANNFRPIDAALWSLASSHFVDGVLTGRQIFLVAGGGGSAKTGIKNKVVLGYLGHHDDSGKFVELSSIEMDDLPNSVAIASPLLSVADSASSSFRNVCAYTNATHCVVCTIEGGRALRVVSTVPISANKDLSPDKNPLAFNVTGNILVTGTEAGDLCVWSIDRDTLRVVRLAKESVVVAETDTKSSEQRVGIIDVDFLDEHNFAVACDDGVCRLYRVAGNVTSSRSDAVRLELLTTVDPQKMGKLSHVATKARRPKCSSCKWVRPSWSPSPLLVIATNGRIEYSGIGRKRKVTKHPCRLFLFSVKHLSDSTVSVSMLCERKIPLQLPVNCCAVNHDKTRLALGHKDGSLTVWSLDKERKLGFLRLFSKMHLFAINGMSFFGTQNGPNGALAPPVVTISGDGLLRLLPVSPVPPSRFGCLQILALFVLLVAVLVPAVYHACPGVECVPESEIREMLESLGVLQK